MAEGEIPCKAMYQPVMAEDEVPLKEVCQSRIMAEGESPLEAVHPSCYGRR
jgi:hypothetical protein